MLLGANGKPIHTNGHASTYSGGPLSVEDFLRPRRSQGYKVPSVLGSGLVGHAIDDRPLFTWMQADRMRRDPQVDFGLRIIRTPIYGATWDVKCRRTVVAQFVHSTLMHFWQRCLRKIFRFYEYGVSVGEVTHKFEKRIVKLDRLDDFHPRDTRPLEFNSGRKKGELAGVRLRNVETEGHVNILSPHCWWFSGEAEYGSLYGRPRLAGAYEPWLEKRGRNGATDSRRLWYKKCAFRGGVMRHPPGSTDMGDETQSILRSNQDIAREICEKFENGGILALLNTTDQNGNFLWAYEPPASHPDVAGLREYPKDLDREILIGLGIPPELVEAATVGSGYSGRAIPAQVFFTSIDEIVALILETVDRLIVRPLVRLNFGPVPYHVLPRSLAVLVAKEPGGSGQPKGGDGADLMGKQQGRALQGGGEQEKEPLSVELSDALVNRVKALADQEYPDLESVLLSDANPAKDKTEVRRAIYDAMLQAAARIQGGDEDAQDDLDALADLAADDSDLLLNLSWTSYGTSASGKPRWKNTETGRVRYQESKPGEKREKRQASDKRARELADEMQSHLLHPEDFPAPTPEKWQELADNLPALSVDALKSVRNRLLLSAPDAKRHAELVEAIKGHIAAGPKSVEKEEPKQASESKPTESAPKNPTPGKVYNVALSDLHVDPERFQFKLNVKGPEGVGEELKGVTKFNPDFAGVLSVWKDPDNGKTYVINGHHRHELADRTGHPSLAVRYIDAKDATIARGKGALINIAEGRGTAVDAAKFMRDTGTTPEDFGEQGISLKGQVARDAAVLMNLSDPLFTRVARGTLETDRAIAIAAHLPDKDRQTELLNHIEREEERTGKEYSPKIVAEAAQEMATTPTVQDADGPDLFGEVNDKSVFMQRSELKAHVRGELAKELRDFQAVASQRRAEAVSGAGNVLNVDANREKAKQAENRVDMFSRLASYKGELSDLLNQQAEKYANAKSNKERDGIRKETVERIRSALSEIEQRGIPAVGGGGEGARETATQ